MNKNIILTSLIALATGAFMIVSDIPDTLSASVFKHNAQKLLTECIRSYSDIPLVDLEISFLDLNVDDHDDAFIQYTKGDACGSTGCVYELCMYDSGSYTHVPFGIAGTAIEAKQTMTNGMRDLEIKNDEKFRLVWNGTNYDLEHTQ